LELSQNINLQLKQKLTLSKEMLLSLKLIQLPLLDLKEKIEQEIIENPALEIHEKKKDKVQDIERIENSFIDKDDYFEDSSSAYISSGIAPTSSDMDLNRQFLEGVITKKDSLADHLLSQLHVQNLTEKQKEIGESIISLINEDGFFVDDIEDVFPKEQVSVANDILEIIQLFDPPGIASRGIKEALLFQIESLKKDEINDISYEILKEHFDLMLARKDTELAKKLKITAEELREALRFISNFNPYPGRNITDKETRYVVPDVFIYKREGSLVVEMNDDILPSLTINKYIEKISREKQQRESLKEEKKFLQKKVSDARQFINLIDYRNSSLFKLSLILVKMQEDFFFKGPKYLKPLTMKEAAEEIGLSESTISRLSSSKYIQTEWGIHEIKYFFTNSVGNSADNEGKSSESIRELIKEIFENEKGNKISDQRISEILNEKGIKIARRTVAKYRKILNILPSHQRNI